ncbi:hypothetical protein XFF6994_4490007 [Xanthomonas citri pv. fuscans]|nr:hypothetical protein XFF6994_4490007 [Xanthomonas citri pv. fuscans]
MRSIEVHGATCSKETSKVRKRRDGRVPATSSVTCALHGARQLCARCVDSRQSGICATQTHLQANRLPAPASPAPRDDHACAFVLGWTALTVDSLAVRVAINQAPHPDERLYSKKPHRTSPEGLSLVLQQLGAEGGTRTHTLLRAADFESAASTDSATSAWPRSIATSC